MLDHREIDDRRSFESHVKIPSIDIKGKLIQQDRRHIPDRRIANIEVKEYDSFFNDEFLRDMI